MSVCVCVLYVLGRCISSRGFLLENLFHVWRVRFTHLRRHSHTQTHRQSTESGTTLNAGYFRLFYSVFFIFSFLVFSSSVSIPELNFIYKDEEEVHLLCTWLSHARLPYDEHCVFIFSKDRLYIVFLRFFFFFSVQVFLCWVCARTVRACVFVCTALVAVAGALPLMLPATIQHYRI